MTSQKKFYLNPLPNNRDSYFYKNHTFYLEINRLYLESQLLKMFNSHFSSLNKCSDGGGWPRNAPKPYLWQTFCTCHALFFIIISLFFYFDVIVSKVAPALISTVFELQSSAIHHRKGFCEAVWKKFWKVGVWYWKFWLITRASFVICAKIMKRAGGFAACS